MLLHVAFSRCVGYVFQPPGLDTTYTREGKDVSFGGPFA